MAKLSDVAEKAGVSITTASMALSGKGRISMEVRSRVNEAAESIGYKKKSKSEGSLWLLLITMHEYDYLSYFFNSIIRELQSAALSHGYTLTILPVWENIDEDELFQEIKNTRAGSVFTIHFASKNLLTRLEGIGIPCIVINNSTYMDRFFTVCVDDFHGAYEGTLQLIKAGHRSIAFMDYPRATLPGIATDRFFGFRKAIEEKGLSFPDDWRKTIDFNDYGQIEKALAELLEGPTAKPTALFVHDDMLAAKVVYVLNTMRMSVPEQLSLIAPGDTLNYKIPETAQISTMRIDTGLMGQYAVNMLLERLQKGEQAAHVLKIKQSYQDRGTIMRGES